MPVHLRADWVPPAPPITGPAIAWPQIDTVAIHYTAAADLPDGDPTDRTDVAAYLRAIHRDYLTSRGYSIGYSWAVDWRGDAWQLRGWDIKCAANRGWNDRSVAILCLVDGADPVTPAAANTIRQLVAEAERRAGRALTIRPHSSIGATQCPGDGIRAQIAAGIFRPTYEPPQPPPIETPPPQEDDDMPKYLSVTAPGKGGALVAIDGAGITMLGYATPADRDKVNSALGATALDISAEQFDAWVAAAKS